MRVPLSWLRDYAPFDLEPTELGRVFDDLGMVVEGVEHVGGGLDHVVVGRVVEIELIPKAAKIRKVLVDDGTGDPVQVVCGAWNFEEGAKVAFAQVGAVLPGDFRIGVRKAMGVESRGMICSAKELDLGEDASGIMVLSADAPSPGTPLREALGIESDVVYDLAIEGNRPDANCITGVARDAAARLGLPFALPGAAVATGAADSVSENGLASIRVDAPRLCPRFTATVLTGVTVGESPAWLQHRLRLAGMRPINNVVDASNYVMLELGQPTHPYDLAKLAGRGLVVRGAEVGEVVRTLDGVDRRVGDGEDCLICDATGEPVGVAGIMGGASSEIDSDTTEVLLEAAAFDPMAIARTSKRLGLRSEASARFEKGTDPSGIDRSVARFCELVGTGQISGPMLDDRSGLQPRQPITVRVARVNSLLGTGLDGATIAGYLEPIGFVSHQADTAGVLDVLPPSFRPDVELEINVIEEVARHHGYAKIVRRVPRSPEAGRLTTFQRERRLVRQILVGAGVDEALTPSLVGPGDLERAGQHDSVIRAESPMIQEESILRTSMLPGLLRTLAFNAARRTADVAFFEIGKVFHVPSGDVGRQGLDATLPDEHERLAAALGGSRGGAPAAKRLWDTLVEGLRLANVTLEATESPGLHPGRTARIHLSGVPVGQVGEVDPSVSEAWGVEGRVGWIEVDLLGLVAAPRRSMEEQPLSRFPSSDIDLAFLVPDAVPAAEVEASVRKAGGDLLVDLRLFDVYRGERLQPGVRSLAYRLRFCALDRTLTDADVAAARSSVISSVEQAHGAALRG
ncbi:MAG: Phenylalanyl-tRNA synthetase beta chain [uncultured Acidimicrobiales bacterium]|uniref:Phenylalanine--tRNA ligase beta subunit n=1 Tax=uncultured Acidimicrobiales bacterium TaxID=310071 RepID=A0A6J4INJ7_9ACTN|nr:MAG: Phenylalanyl-tRNA synthetase beta chain [uncultured Acidimicrobiales bacterium]